MPTEPPNGLPNPHAGETVSPPSETLTPRRIKGYGCIPDQPNKNRPLFRLTHADTLSLPRPSQVDLWKTGFMPPIWNQGNLGSCTAHGILRCLEFRLKMEGIDFMPSRLELYYQERLIEGTVDTDAGAQIADGITVLNTIGVGHETLWTYDDKDTGSPKDKFRLKPSAAVTADAAKHKIARGSSVRGLSELLACLASGYPVVGGISVHESFETEWVSNGNPVPMPTSHDPMIGGHCIAFTGYDDRKKLITFDNSWSKMWGNDGRGFLPYAYIEDHDLTSDMWSIRTLAAK